MRLSVASWNVNDIAHKPDLVNREFKTVDPSFINYIKHHDIVGLSETKIGLKEKIIIEGYQTHQIINRSRFDGEEAFLKKITSLVIMHPSGTGCMIVCIQ